MYFSSDMDADKIANYLDVCPKTPKGAKVDRYGCAIDTDMDGVIDFYDHCPNTPFDILVDQYGCKKN